MSYNNTSVGYEYGGKMAKQRKQVSLDFIEYTQRTINDLLASEIPQFAKHKLCIMMEKLLRDMKHKENNFKYLYWNRYGKLDWNAEKNIHLKKLSIGDKISIPKEYITGPEYNKIRDDEKDNYNHPIEGEWSREYY